MREENVAKTRIWNCMGAMRTVEGIWKDWGSGRVVRKEGRRYGCAMKTGFGVQERPVKMFAPRSWRQCQLREIIEQENRR